MKLTMANALEIVLAKLELSVNAMSKMPHSFLRQFFIILEVHCVTIYH
jgi:hypothetical protein